MKAINQERTEIIKGKDIDFPIFKCRVLDYPSITSIKEVD